MVSERLLEFDARACTPANRFEVGDNNEITIIRTKMNSKLYVGHLSYSTSEDQLRNLFLQAGTVLTISLITDRESHQSKGFAFVEMGNQAEALKAIEMFDGCTLDDQVLRVSMAHQGKERVRLSGRPRRPP